MKKVALFLAFMVVWFAVAGFCLLIGDLFNIDFFQSPANYIQIGLSAALAGLFGPPLAAYAQKLFRKKKS